MVGVEGFGEVGGDAAGLGFLAFFVAFQGGEHEDGDVAGLGVVFELAADFEAVGVGEH